VILALLLTLSLPALAVDTDAPPAGQTEPDVDTEPQPDVETEPQPDVDTEPQPDVETEPDIDTESDGDAATIVVYGEHLVDQARSAVESELQDQGYDQRIRKDGYTVFRHADVWKGEVRVYDDGWVRMRRQPVQFKPPKGSPVGWATCVVVPLCVRSGGQTVSKRKHMAQRRRALAEIAPLARQYGDRVADLHVDRRIDELPERLTALWQDGVPLEEGAEPMPSMDARKQALLDFWESRTETVWGRRVRAAVEAFIREEVQYSPFPFTDAEIAAFNRTRHTESELDLDRPWEQVLADLEHRAGL